MVEEARERVSKRDLDKDIVLSGAGSGETFVEVAGRRYSRRSIIRRGVALGAIVLAGSALGGAVPVSVRAAGSRAAGGPGAAPGPAPGIGFEPIQPTGISVDEIAVARGHGVEPLLKWGDPIRAGGPDYDSSNQTRERQEQQFGYNCDFLAFLPLPHGSMGSDRGLLWVNHEYTNPELMFAGYDEKNPTRQQVDVELAAHGASIVALVRTGSGRFVPDLDAPFNRRITAFTSIRLSGPAAGHDLLKTAADPTGTVVEGMLNNCAGGVTPWGTVLSAEENFHQYFANLGGLDANDPRAKYHARYGLPKGESERKWERFYSRFDLAREPNEAFRFGWVVEVDPYDPASVPVKRTALGRFRHEGATFAVSPSNRVAFYSGDDERFEYVYKFVTDRPYDPANRAANADLLDSGTLYVARFNDDGTGDWLPLTFGQGPLTPANGFASQADVLIRARQAGDALGATKMDRPEDMQLNPVNRKVYLALTNNNQRGAANRPAPDAANPRPDNKHGHLIELTEQDDDPAATRFTWEIFLLCGDPADPSTYFAGYPKELVSPVSCPDNVNFDADGNLWIATDGMPSSLKINDGIIVVPTQGNQRGNAQMFLSAVAGSETASLEFIPDNRTFFVSIQHPGEGGTVEKPISRWPDGTGLARPSVVQVWNLSGGRVGGGAK